MFFFLYFLSPIFEEWKEEMERYFPGISAFCFGESGQIPQLEVNRNISDIFQSIFHFSIKLTLFLKNLIKV